MDNKKDRKSKEHELPINTYTGIESDEQIVKDSNIYVTKANWGHGFEFLFIARHIQNDAPLVGRIRYEHASVSAGEKVEPSLTMRPDYAQRLMDELWRAGLRPSDEIGYPGELAATRLHLTDARTMNKQLLDEVLKRANTS